MAAPGACLVLSGATKSRGQASFLICWCSERRRVAAFLAPFSRAAVTSRPEPGRQRRVTALHDSPSHQAYVFATGAAAQNTRARFEPEWFADNAASRADEPTMPAGLFEICSTGRVVGKKALKFRQRPRKRQIFTCQDNDP
jgi:hypothetical protein